VGDTPVTGAYIPKFGFKIWNFFVFGPTDKGEIWTEDSSTPNFSPSGEAFHPWGRKTSKSPPTELNTAGND